MFYTYPIHNHSLCIIFIRKCGVYSSKILKTERKMLKRFGVFWAEWMCSSIFTGESLTFKLSLFLFKYCFRSDRCFLKLIFGWWSQHDSEAAEGGNTNFGCLCRAEGCPGGVSQHGAIVVSCCESTSPLAPHIQVFLLIYQCTDGQVMGRCYRGN